MKNPFDKLNKKKYFQTNVNARTKIMTSPNAVIDLMPKETLFKAKDVAILRECLSGLHKKTPPILQKKITDALLWFATSVKDYCKCEDKVYIESENRHACLNCGIRHVNKDGDPKLVEVPK